MDKTDKIFRGIITFIFIGAIFYCFGAAIYWTYFFEPHGFDEIFKAAEEILISLTGFGVFLFLSYFIIELWEKDQP